MQKFRANITKRRVKQKNREGKVFEYDRYMLHYNDPATGKRKMLRFETRKEAEAAQNQLIKSSDDLARRKTEPPTLQEAVDYWIKSREGSVSDHTLKTYKQLGRDWIIGPAIDGTSRQRRQYGMTGKRPPGVKLIPMLGSTVKVDEIRTAEIRTWFQQVRQVATPYMAKATRKALSSIFRLIEEDFDLRLARMPTRNGAAYRRQQRKLLTEDEAKSVIDAARADKKWGVYYAFPLLTGTRPNEQLGLLWEDVDLARGRIRIHRSQQNDGSLKPFTKTDAGMREIPINSILLEMLTEWKERCPRLHGRLHRVFPQQPHPQGSGRQMETTSDGGLSLSNFRTRVWYPMLRRLRLPQVPPYAARHMVISFLQAQGVEIGLVAKIAGHANPQVTLQYYTHAVRESDGMMDELNAAYGVRDKTAAPVAGVQV